MIKEKENFEKYFLLHKNKCMVRVNKHVFYQDTALREGEVMEICRYQLTDIFDELRTYEEYKEALYGDVSR